MNKVQHGISPDIISDIFRKRNMAYSTRNSTGFETRNIRLFIMDKKQLHI